MERVSSKIKKYEKIILDALQDLKSDSPYHYLICDKINRHYQIVYAGPNHKGVYIYVIKVHFHIREDAKICIFENATEIEFLDIFLPQGIPKKDLLPQYIDASLRQIAGYAA